jgi:hypothetical protein
VTARHDAHLDTVRGLLRSVADIRRFTANVVQPNLNPRAHIRLHHSATFSVATNTLVTHPWNTTTLNTDSTVFSVSSGIVTVAVDGDYAFAFTVATDSNASTASREAYVDINSSGSDDRYGLTSTAGSGAARHLQGSGLVPLTAGDTLRVVCFHNVGSTQTWGFASRPGLEHFQIWKARHGPLT